MSDSTTVVVDSFSWTDVSKDMQKGFITNEGSKTVFCVEKISNPGEDLQNGHSLYPRDFLSFDLIPGQNIYSRSTDGEVELSVTPS